jgi:glycosyltransferase involved in cell wall biosynthesis
MSISLCVNTQTPFIRFKLGFSELLERYEGLKQPVDLSELVEGEDYDYTPGGVTAMVYPLLNRLMQAGFVSNASWVSLGPNAPPEVVVKDIRLHHVTLSDEEIPLYTNFKEKIYNELHGIGRLDIDPAQYEAYVNYNWFCAKHMMKLIKETKLYFIHDFQQLLTGIMLGPSAPTILRWHIPFRLEGATQSLKLLVTKGVEAFDAVIVSTRRDLEGLIRAGYRGRAYQLYPYVDPKRWSTPSQSFVQETKDTLGIKDDDVILLVVGRMDRIKSQDLAINAFAQIKKKYPHTRLVLVGDGSFTGSQRGGLSHPKVRSWRSHLKALASDLKVDDGVLFTGHVGEDVLKCLYSICYAVIVSSRVEGFNLTAIEGWLYRKPVVVSTGAGCAELVIDQVNGLLFDQGDVNALASKLDFILSKPEKASKMGETGFQAAPQCFVGRADSRLQEIFNECMALYT